MAKSLAFWLDGNKSSSASVELHFNYWSLSSSPRREINYLDVGIKFFGVGDAKSINVFFPFPVDENKYVAGLGRVVCNADSLISAIFNTNIKEKKPNGERSDITFLHEQDTKLRFHSQIELGPQGEGVSITSLGDTGATISFPVELFRSGRIEESDQGEVHNYIRFRIIMSEEDKKVLSQVYKSKDSKLLSRLESTEVVDFRVNEIRNLPPQIRSKLENDSCITTVHFFLIRETESEHKLSHTEFKRCRVLEKDLWDAYLNVGCGSGASIPEQMLIYHWKEQAKSEGSSKPAYLENFAAFAKFSKTTVSMTTIGYFAITVVLLGLFSGFLSGIGASYAYSWLTKEDSVETEDFAEAKNSAVLPSIVSHSKN